MPVTKAANFPAAAYNCASFQCAITQALGERICKMSTRYMYIDVCMYTIHTSYVDNNLPSLRFDIELRTDLRFHS